MALTGIILDVSYFSQAGFDRIPTTSTNNADLADCIVEWEKQILYKMLSNNLQGYPAGGLADLFCTDALANAGVPVTPRFAFIYQPFNIMFGDRMYSSKGMLRMMKSMIYYYYVTEVLSSQITTGGVTSNQSAAAQEQTMAKAYRQAESRWNDALESYRSIIWWLQAGNGIATIGAGGGGAAEYPEYLRASFDVKEFFKAKYQSLL